MHFLRVYIDDQTRSASEVATPGTHRYPERLSWPTTPEFHKIGMEPEKWSLKGDFPTKKGSI